MQESAKAAFSFVRSNTQLLGIDEDDFAKSVSNVTSIRFNVSKSTS